MYLLTQIWWSLLLAFLLGATVGYLLWRICSRPMLESRFERSRTDMASRLSLLEDERANFMADEHAAGGDEVDKLRTELAALKASLADHTKSLTAARDDETKLKAELASLRKRTNDAESEAARHAEDLAKTRATAMAPATAQSLAPANTVAKPAAASLNSKGDDLKLIWGAGPEIEKLLNDNGIHRFDQIANWTGKDLAWFDSLSPAFKGRAVSEKWIEQCQKLATGWRPEREIGDKPKDILTAPRNGKADDLKLIWGVGPKLEALLNKAGFYHFDQIAKWTVREIEWVDTQLGDFAGRAVRDKWVEQCKKLVTGWRPDSDVGQRPK
jgi:predicted flap endonuclease-1-like 5' DNA nuclease